MSVVSFSVFQVALSILTSVISFHCFIEFTVLRLYSHGFKHFANPKFVINEESL